MEIEFQVSTAVGLQSKNELIFTYEESTQGQLIASYAYHDKTKTHCGVVGFTYWSIELLEKRMLHGKWKKRLISSSVHAFSIKLKIKPFLYGKENFTSPHNFAT